MELSTQQAVTNCHCLSLDPYESVLKLSQVVKCDFGHGFIGLTQKRSVKLAQCVMVIVKMYCLGAKKMYCLGAKCYITFVSG